MKTPRILSCVAALFTVFLAASPARASLIDFTFTGTGSNGSVAVGAFTFEETGLVPSYFFQGTLPSISVSISNIPGGGPSAVTFDTNDLPFTWLYVNASSEILIGPYGGHSFGGPEFNHYDLGQPDTSTSLYRTALTYNGSSRDTITWSVATRGSAEVPEAGSTVEYLAIVSIMLAGGYRRLLRRR